MRRLLCLIVLLPGLHAQAWAQQSPAIAASAPAPAGNDTITAYLMQRFGVAKEKATTISTAVTTAAEKYSLPPAVLLAIISIESRFREKAHGANGATGLMQVVPSAHRNLLRNVKDLTKPDVNIDIGSSILYGYKRAAGGDLAAAMKSYGGSTAYAQKIQSRAVEFNHLFETPAATQAGSDAADAADASAVPAVFVAPAAFFASSAAASVVPAGSDATATAAVQSMH
ncbi:transglycosylase SLT domain-containing protein [Paraburkholderia ferrariae]|uniref:transglycosylase SLT domain-containing protein n=1 Tax=Paraburkholderia ferrariae TaxID=386056 RepID=UPI00048992BA|nr:transglycosylase SLT domain-containing protein [Paraburkholderia ferrariae]